MTIADRGGEGKALLSRIPRDFLAILILLLVASAAFGLGILTDRELTHSAGGGLWVEQVPLQGTTTAAAAAALPVKDTPTAAPIRDTAPAPAVSTDAPTGQPGAYVGSVNGHSYYLPSCSGVKRISPQNLVWFASKADA